MIAAALTGQMATGVILGVPVQTLLAYDHAAVGRGVVDVARESGSASGTDTRRGEVWDSQLTDTMVEHRSRLPSLLLGGEGSKGAEG
jgi:hypothetical protein